MQKLTLIKLTKRLSKKYEQPTYIVKFWINAIINSILEIIKNDETLTLSEFGTFKLNHKKESRKYHIKNNEFFMDKAHSVPAFKFSQTLKREIRKKTYKD
jgi:nucleoid DNA-binding protein